MGCECPSENTLLIFKGCGGTGEQEHPQTILISRQESGLVAVGWLSLLSLGFFWCFCFSLSRGEMGALAARFSSCRSSKIHDYTVAFGKGCIHRAFK